MKVIVIKETDTLGFNEVKELQLYVEGKVEFYQNADGFVRIREVKNEGIAD